MRVILMSSLVLSSAVFAFELKKDREGDVVRWQGTVHFVVDPKLDQHLHAPGALEAVKATFATWSLAVPNVTLTVEEGDVSTASSTITVIDHDWPYDDGVFAVTISKVDVTNNRIIESDIYFNAAQNKFKVLTPDSTRGGDFGDVQNTLTHELGHALGLQHEKNDEEAVMFPLAYNGDVNKRSLAADDLAGLDALYPLDAMGPPAGCSATGSAPLAGLMALCGVVLSRARKARTAPASGRC